jgi:hypothetical protein
MAVIETMAEEVDDTDFSKLRLLEPERHKAADAVLRQASP